MAGRRGRLLTTIAGPGRRSGAGRGLGASWASLVPEAGAVVLQALLRLVPQRAVQPQPVPRARRLLPADGLAGGAQPAGPRAGLGGAPAAPAGRPRWRALDREGRLVALYGLLTLGWLVIAAQHRLPDLRRPGRRAHHRAVAVGLAGPGAAGRRRRGADVAADLPALRLAGPAAAAAAARRRRRAPRRAGRAAPARRAARVQPARPAAGRRWPPWPPRPAGCTRAPASSSSSPAPPSRRSSRWSTGALEARAPSDPGGTVRATGRRRAGWSASGRAVTGAPVAAGLVRRRHDPARRAVVRGRRRARAGRAAAGDRVGTADEAEALFAETPGDWPHCPTRTGSGSPRSRCRSRWPRARPLTPGQPGPGARARLRRAWSRPQGQELGRGHA